MFKGIRFTLDFKEIFASGGQRKRAPLHHALFCGNVNERCLPCDLTGDLWNQHVVERIERLKVLQNQMLQNRRDDMSKVKWETVPLHRVGDVRKQDRWSWALDLLIVDKVVHWSVEDQTLSELTD